MRYSRPPLACLVFVIASLTLAAQTASPPVRAGAEYSGMYSFLRDGEFVQVTVEDQGKVRGYVSRYGDSDSDRGAFLDQFFKQGKLEGNRLAFTTETVHGIWYEFQGTIERGDGKTRADEAFYVIRGTLIEHSTDEQEKAPARSRAVALKSFPKEAAPNPK